MLVTESNKAAELLSCVQGYITAIYCLVCCLVISVSNQTSTIITAMFVLLITQDIVNYSSLFHESYRLIAISLIGISAVIGLSEYHFINDHNEIYSD